MLRSVLQHLALKKSCSYYSKSGIFTICSFVIYYLFVSQDGTCLSMQNILMENFSHFIFNLREKTYGYLIGSKQFSFPKCLRKVRMAHNDNGQGVARGGLLDEYEAVSN